MARQAVGHPRRRGAVLLLLLVPLLLPLPLPVAPLLPPRPALLLVPAAATPTATATPTPTATSTPTATRTPQSLFVADFNTNNVTTFDISSGAPTSGANTALPAGATGPIGLAVQ
ncbi:MAG TPA: hypothetical protein VFE37_22440 [Chloroflexota bacterium]|nr:hypothetical protein [Chloroflexota bacterium]